MPFTPVTLWETVLEAVADRVEALSLADDLEARVYRRTVPQMALLSLPCVVVSYEGCVPEVLLNSTSTDETVLPVRVHLLDRRDPMDDSKRARWFGWALQLMTAFRARALSGVSEAWRCDVEQMTAFDASRALGPAYQHAVANFLVKARCLTERLA